MFMCSMFNDLQLKMVATDLMFYKLGKENSIKQQAKLWSTVSFPSPRMHGEEPPYSMSENSCLPKPFALEK